MTAVHPLEFLQIHKSCGEGCWWISFQLQQALSCERPAVQLAFYFLERWFTAQISNIDTKNYPCQGELPFPNYHQLGTQLGLHVSFQGSPLVVYWWIPIAFSSFGSSLQFVCLDSPGCKSWGMAACMGGEGMSTRCKKGDLHTPCGGWTSKMMGLNNRKSPKFQGLMDQFFMLNFRGVFFPNA